MTKDKKQLLVRLLLGQKLNVQKSTSHHPLWMHHQRLTVLDTVGLELSQWVSSTVKMFTED